MAGSHTGAVVRGRGLVGSHTGRLHGPRGEGLVGLWPARGSAAKANQPACCATAALAVAGGRVPGSGKVEPRSRRRPARLVQWVNWCQAGASSLASLAVSRAGPCCRVEAAALRS